MGVKKRAASDSLGTPYMSLSVDRRSHPSMEKRALDSLWVSLVAGGVRSRQGRGRQGCPPRG